MERDSRLHSLDAVDQSKKKSTGYNLLCVEIVN